MTKDLGEELEAKLNLDDADEPKSAKLERQKSTASKAGDGAKKGGVFGKLFNGGEDSAIKTSLLQRKESRKKEKDEKTRRNSNASRVPPTDKLVAPTRPRSPSNVSSNHETRPHANTVSIGDFMKNKMTRSVSRKSDDGHSEKQTVVSGGHDDTRSRAGSSVSQLKKYGVCERVVIGKGATAVVKLAHKWDRTTERLYAVKEFRKRRKNETEKEYVKKLTSEFCISSTLHHANIVETVDLVQDEQMHWCEVMEYCPGGDLYAVIKKGDLEIAEINSYFKQIISGIAYIHSMGVAHRDIKPENLLLDAQGHVKITDFGVSDVFRMCWEKTAHLSKGLCGSEPYIAPEQFDQKEYDARFVDVWATAIVFYCMHFQELPWRVAKHSDPSFGPYCHDYAQEASPAPISNIPTKEARHMARIMLDPNPKTRATTDVIQNDPWFKAIEIVPPLNYQ